jgi:lysophospholipase L1-like esterase
MLAVLEIAVRIVNAIDNNYLDELANFRSVATNRDLTLADLVRPVRDDLIVYQLRPGVRGRFLGHEVSINSLGMRGPERPLRKQPGVRRIVGLGDSQMFGWGVAQPDTFLALLEAMLNNSGGDRWEILNLAVPGYNTVQEVQAFAARVEELDPDLIVINYVDNDMDLPNFLAQRRDPYTLRTSYLANLVKRRWVILNGSSLLPISLIGVPMDQRSLRYRLPEDRVPERFRPLYGRENMIKAFSRLAAIARSRGVPVLLLLNMDDYRHRLAGRSPSVLPKPVRRLAEFCAGEGYLVVDPQDRIMEYLVRNSLQTQDLWVNKNDSHPNEIRHRLVAEELFDRMRTEGLAPVP